MSEAELPKSDDSPPPGEPGSVDAGPPQSAQPATGAPDATPDVSPSQLYTDEPAAEATSPLTDAAQSGPTVMPGQWLGGEAPWPPGIQRLAGRALIAPPQGRRFLRLPRWFSGGLLAAVALLALLAAIVVARTASVYLPGHVTSTPAAQHSPTPTPRHTASPTK